MRCFLLIDVLIGNWIQLARISHVPKTFCHKHLCHLVQKPLLRYYLIQFYCNMQQWHHRVYNIRKDNCYTHKKNVPLYGCRSASHGMNAPSDRTSSGTSGLQIMCISLLRVDCTLTRVESRFTNCYTLQRCHSGWSLSYRRACTKFPTRSS